MAVRWGRDAAAEGYIRTAKMASSDARVAAIQRCNGVRIAATNGAVIQAAKRQGPCCAAGGLCCADAPIAPRHRRSISTLSTQRARARALHRHSPAMPPTNNGRAGERAKNRGAGTAAKSGRHDALLQMLTRRRAEWPLDSMQQPCRRLPRPLRSCAEPRSPFGRHPFRPLCERPDLLSAGLGERAAMGNVRRANHGSIFDRFSWPSFRRLILLQLGFLFPPINSHCQQGLFGLLPALTCAPIRLKHTRTKPHARQEQMGIGPIP